MKDSLTHARLCEVLDYEALTGAFRWKIRPCRNVFPGSIAGSFTWEGYIEIGIDKVRYRAHRLAWLYVHGNWPAYLDHKNGVKSDNRISNLREATIQQNGANRRINYNNPSGFKGVSAGHNGKWYASLSKRRKRVFFGTFDTKVEAHAAYIAAAREHFGEFARSD